LLILGKREVRGILSMEKAIEATKEALIRLSERKVDVPGRHQIHINSQKADMLVMSGLVGDEELLGVKIVSLFPNNTVKGLPATVGSIALVDNKTGNLEAVMDASYLTAVRTGASSAVATDALAMPGASTLAVIGSGSMSFCQAEGVALVRPINRIILYSRTRSKSEKLAENLEVSFAIAGRPISVEISDSSEDACSRSEIICACTTSSTPVVLGKWVQPGTHVNATGAFNPSMQEVDEDLVRFSDVVSVDTKPGALLPGDLSLPIFRKIIREDRVIEIGTILRGVAIGRRTINDRTFFKSIGTAAQDVLCGWLVFHEALKRGVGDNVSLE